MLSTDLQRGGFPLRLARLAVGLRGRGVEPVVGCLASRGPMHEYLESAGIETFSCDAGGRFDPKCIWRLAGHVRRINPDLIHSSLFHANLAARLVGRIDRCRPLVTGSVTIEIERRWHRVGEALTCGWSDVHVANSEAVAEHLRADLGFPPERVVVIPNGVSVDEVERAPAVDRRREGLAVDVPLVLWAGRMDPVKNLPLFIEIISAVAAQMEVQAVLLGDGPERGRVESLIQRRRLEGVVRLAPWSDNVWGWLKAADLLVFPSLTEGSPNVVLEAMASGCPVIASDEPACRELIEHDKHGWLCPSRSTAAFAELVCYALAHHRERERVAKAARVRVAERHDAGAVVESWRTLYERLAGGAA